MAKLAAGVGAGQANRAQDVTTVQVLLNQCRHLLAPQRPLRVDGQFGPATQAAINKFQARVLSARAPDGIIAPEGPTLRALLVHAAPHQPAGKTAPALPKDADKISAEAYVAAARQLGVEAAAIQAVVLTELGIRGPFDAKGRPTILFERHRFSALSANKFDKAHPDISNPVRGGYGYFSEQYPKLERAIKLDKTAALMASSWGAFQIMGENFGRAGFSSVDLFVAAMKLSVGHQLNAFVAFVKSDPALNKALKLKHWERFAKGYNGTAYKENAYDVKMRDNYNRIVQAKAAAAAAAAPAQP